MLVNKKILTVYIVLAVVTLMVFWRVVQFDFINFDDPYYVVNNIHIQHGVTTEAISWAFTTGHAGNWHPLTWISHMLDVHFFGLNPQWHHLMNLLFHIANTLLLFFVLYRMTKAFWQSAFVAALFALHPLHVESVAWVAERKDVLSTFFWILTMGAYCYYVERPGVRRYLPVLLLFALGLMAKPMLVTLPFVLLLLDYWPLRRFEENISDHTILKKSDNPIIIDKRKGKSKKKHSIIIKEDSCTVKSADTKFRWAMIRPLFLEKIPLFVLAALSIIVTFIVQQKDRLVVPLEKLPLGDRIANAFVSYFTYIEKAIWPNNLAFYYPYQWWASWQVLGALLFFITVTSILIWVAKKYQYLIVGWLWYVGTLVPVIGLIQVGSQARADRYTYIPLIGLFIMAAWGIPVLLEKLRYRKEVLIALSTLTLSCLFMVTWTQVGYWQNSITLFDRSLKVTKNNYVAFKQRGDAYATLGNYKQAIADFDQAIALTPIYGLAYMGRANAEYELRNDEKAISDYTKAIEIMPKYTTVYYYRGNAYADLGQYKKAIDDYSRSIQLEPFAEVHGHRGYVYAALGQYKQAIEDFDRTIQLELRSAQAYGDRGHAYAALGNHQQAVEDYSIAIDMNPKFAAAYYNRAASYNSLGDKDHTYRDLKIAAALGNSDAQNILRSQGMNW
jgi:tetratricopeptide (TPR) repeat protein